MSLFPPEPIPKRTKVLAVDDDGPNLVALSSALEGLDIELHCVDSGEAALATLLDHEFALVLLDVLMPGMDGFETARLIRGRRRSRSMPIVFMTAYQHSDAHVAQGYELGAVDYIFKPIADLELRSKVQLFCSLYEEGKERDQLRLDHAHKAEALERSSREFRDFSYSASHDLRAPVRHIRALTERLQQQLGPALTHEAGTTISAISDAAGRIDAALIAMLEYAKVDSAPNRLEHVQLDKVAALVVHELGMDIETTGAEVETGPLPDIVADASQMYQLLHNLVGNALKYRRKQENPRVHIWATPTTVDEEGDSWVSLMVSDNGIGFDTEMLPRMCRPFERLVSRSQYAGSGIGLATVKRIVDRHGGQLQATSTPGRGSTFFIALPIRPTPPANEAVRQATRPDMDLRPPRPLPQAPRPQAPGGKPSLLLVDDDELDLALALECLREHYEIHTAANAEAGLAQLKAHHFDMIVTDYKMPGCDGGWLLAHARVLAPDTIRILASGAEVPGVDKLVASAVAEQVITKPITPDQIDQIRADHEVDGSPD